MTRIEILKDAIEERGNVMYCNEFNMEDLDSIIKVLDKQERYYNNMIYANPWFFRKLLDLLTQYNKDDPNNSEGVFKLPQASPQKFLIDFSFMRGIYNFHVIAKPMDESYIIPSDISHIEDSFFRNSVLIYQNSFYPDFIF